MGYDSSDRDYARNKSRIAHREPFAVRKSNWIENDGAPPICAIHNEEAKWHRNKARESGGQWVCPTCARTKARGQRRAWKTQHTDPFQYNLKRAFTSAKHHSKKIGRTFAIAFDDVLALWAAQDGKCAITQTPMEFLPGNGERNRNKVTMDRIDSTLGYERGNVWLVCDWVNIAKTSMSKADAILFARGILRAFNTDT